MCPNVSKPSPADWLSESFPCIVSTGYYPVHNMVNHHWWSNVGLASRDNSRWSWATMHTHQTITIACVCLQIHSKTICSPLWIQLGGKESKRSAGAETEGNRRSDTIGNSDTQILRAPSWQAPEVDEEIRENGNRGQATEASSAAKVFPESLPKESSFPSWRDCQAHNTHRKQPWLLMWRTFETANIQMSKFALC